MFVIRKRGVTSSQVCVADNNTSRNHGDIRHIIYHVWAEYDIVMVTSTGTITL